MATPNSISEAAACYVCIESPMDSLLYLFDQIRINGGGAVMTPSELSEAARCYGCIEEKWGALLYLADAIETNGGGGGGGGDLTYTRSAIDPVGAPPTANGIHWNTTTDQLWNWNGAAWV